jgi:hypothetical protein
VLRSIVAVAVCAGLSSGLLASQPETYIGDALGKTYTVTITEQDFKKAPSWDRNAENPPVPAQKALKLAARVKNTLVNDSNRWKWRVDSITLKHYGLADDSTKWYWIVHYEADYIFPSHAVGGTGGVHEMYVIVLMDGSVIKPMVTNAR